MSVLHLVDGPSRLLSALVVGALLSACGGDFRGSDDEQSNDDAGDGNLTLDAGGDGGDDDGEQGCQADSECTDPGFPICDEADGVCYPECEPGDGGSCYEGPPGTEGVGQCAAGNRTCTEFGTWGACFGQVLPSSEICDNDIDEDCNGSLEAQDLDGDGWDSCNGDCCDDELFGCVDAALVNPGAFEVVGNEVDDDCDGEIDEPTLSCDADLASNSDDALDFAAALDLCQTTEEDGETWGVISAELTRADGGAPPLAVQHSIRSSFGDLIDAPGGDSLVVLSSGHAASEGQTSPSFAPFESGENLGTSVDLATLPNSSPLRHWIDENGGQFPASCDGLDPTGNVEANDSVMLTVRVRVPTNARSFSTRMFFFSAEYPEWVCSQFNDFFVALITSEGDNPSDGNIAVYDDNGELSPVGLNILQTAPGLFAVCEDGNVGCQGDLSAFSHSCADGPDLLEGTGFDAIDQSNSCNGNGFPVGGGTGWLEMSGNVEPGEIMELRFAIWDAGGHLFDALVLLDDWQWSLDAAAPGVIVP